MKQSPNLLRIEDVFRRVGFRRNKLYGLLNAGEFPKPVKLGRMSAWVEAEIDQWITDRIAERDAGAPKKPHAHGGEHPASAGA